MTSNVLVIPESNPTRPDLPLILQSSMATEKEHLLLPKENITPAAEARERILRAELLEVPLAAFRMELPAVNSIKINIPRSQLLPELWLSWQSRRQAPGTILNLNILNRNSHRTVILLRPKVLSNPPTVRRNHLDSHAGCRPSLRACTPLRAAHDTKHIFLL